jgi:hypothetical protein
MATQIGIYYAQTVATTIIASSYVALIRQDGTECPVGRIPFGSTSVSNSDPDYYIISNVSEIAFPVATTDVAPISNPITKVALYTQETGGVVIAITDLSGFRPYLTGDQLRIPAGMLHFRVQKVVP